MRIAFYAPLKPPSHPKPCGDRQLARLLLRALQVAGHSPEVASCFRSWDKSGDPVRQRRLRTIGRRLADRLVRRIQSRPPAERPGCWLSFHCYYKAPDWLGPAVAAGCDIPYVMVEPSYAPKRESGPWALGHRATRESVRRADAVISLNSRDVPCLLPLLADSSRLGRLRPFMDTDEVPPEANRVALRRRVAKTLDLPVHEPWILAVGMMRERDKLTSYLHLAEAMSRVRDRRWRLIVVGDGPARARIEAAFARRTPGRVAFGGARSRREVLDFMASADLYAWPAINEGCANAVLEAQAAALPVVAGDFGGVPDIVRDAETGLITEPGDPDALAAGVATLLDDPQYRARLARAAGRVVRRDHDLRIAAGTLQRLLARVAAK